ncbi:hypothetical protein DSM106972_004450 [Dulcicalothrix desertica PCC 7102]|uniref:Peptidoglycan binding-like domain-containing protein n=1 Tax=Dulcicalothrix desertica PCC 7102 TaxID=232991 RepID=A0A3S1CV40_9CYAN|nr:peptidoglycan-binding domain-containing protein [Dulcicalothrix desertica]RUT09950.1 hypothetical protein DSM106972_004450 [Dulcicalothrix desertica PCC 7102]TWH41068.1 N-acetylmuramoyl-L-alanine amidase [Dulcicalothrix desertica PCC 7102]TWH51142.1 N-acetylmuramoyl-L-alanine amidase [Dulcicalothrix desertica PCC 7102]
MSDAFVILQLGFTGATISDLQQDLTTIEYYAGAIDGVFGTKTKKAVVQFQKQFNLNVDGIVD